MTHHRKQIKDPRLVPSSSVDALRIAMMNDGIPSYEFNDLLWIMTQESVGVPGVNNGTTTASGLFQLVETQRQAFYPNGDSSIGNAVEESEGGIRYMLDRYGTAAKARKFWNVHHYW